LQEFTISKFGRAEKISPIVYCDNEALVKKINTLRFRPLSSKFHYTSDCDIIREIIFLLKKLGQLYGFIPGTELSDEAHLNVEADRLATSSLSQPMSKKLTLPNNIASIEIDNKMVTSKHTVHLRDAFHSIALRQHYTTVNSWQNNTFDDIWWDHHGTALHKLSIGQRNYTPKIFSEPVAM
jgi:hypothetical protein